MDSIGSRGARVHAEEGSTAHVAGAGKTVGIAGTVRWIPLATGGNGRAQRGAVWELYHSLLHVIV